MQEEGFFENMALEEDQEERLTQLLDIFVIRLEGGDQSDVDAFLGHADTGNAASLSDASDAQVELDGDCSYELHENA